LSVKRSAVVVLAVSCALALAASSPRVAASAAIDHATYGFVSAGDLRASRRGPALGSLGFMPLRAMAGSDNSRAAGSVLGSLMRAYAFVELGDSEAIDLFLREEDAHAALEDALRDSLVGPHAKRRADRAR
jgi:hypothetical protein